MRKQTPNNTLVRKLKPPPKKLTPPTNYLEVANAKNKGAKKGQAV